MKDEILMPCPEWAEKLAARHPEDISPSDRTALNNLRSLDPLRQRRGRRLREESERLNQPLQPMWIFNAARTLAIDRQCSVEVDAPQRSIFRVKWRHG